MKRKIWEPSQTTTQPKMNPAPYVVRYQSKRSVVSIPFWTESQARLELARLALAGIEAEVVYHADRT